MKVIASFDASAGNESVGDMWTETAIFDMDTPISKVLEWAKMSYDSDYIDPSLSMFRRNHYDFRRNVKLSIAQEPLEKKPKHYCGQVDSSGLRRACKEGIWQCPECAKKDEE